MQNLMINWELMLHVSGSKYHSVLYRGGYMGKGVQCEIHTPVIDDMGGYKEFGEPERYFYIDGDEREFRRQEELIQAILGDE